MTKLVAGALLILVTLILGPTWGSAATLLTFVPGVVLLYLGGREWQAHARAKLKIRCENCQRAYRLCDSALVTHWGDGAQKDDLLGLFGANRSLPGIVGSSSSWGERFRHSEGTETTPDLVTSSSSSQWEPEVTSKQRQIAGWMVRLLEQDSERWWKCAACGKVQTWLSGQRRALEGGASRGLKKVTEYCLRTDLLDDALLARGTGELRDEGPTGAKALAGLLRELLDARSPKIVDVLCAAAKLTPGPELVGAVQDVLCARPLTPQHSSSRFGPETVGEALMGWTDGTDARVRDAARAALRAFGARPIYDWEANEKKREADKIGRPHTSDEKKLRKLITTVGLGLEQVTAVQEYAPTLGEKAIPIIARMLRKDLNGKGGWAAANALRAMNLPSALPVVALALTSTYEGTRDFAIWYLCEYPSDQGKAIALQHFPNEKDSKRRQMLEDLMTNQAAS